MCVHPFCLNLLYGVGNSKKYKELYATMGKHLCVDHMLLYELNDLKQYLSVVMPGQQMVADIPEDNNWSFDDLCILPCSDQKMWKH